MNVKKRTISSSGTVIAKRRSKKRKMIIGAPGGHQPDFSVINRCARDWQRNQEAIGRSGPCIATVFK